MHIRWQGASGSTHPKYTFAVGRLRGSEVRSKPTNFKDEDFCSSGRSVADSHKREPRIDRPNCHRQTPPSIKSVCQLSYSLSSLGRRVICLGYRFGMGKQHSGAQGIDPERQLQPANTTSHFQALPILQFPFHHPMSKPESSAKLLNDACLAADRWRPRSNSNCFAPSNTRQSLLLEAFAGRLVNQNPNDEPASLLLEHILSIREAEARKSKRLVLCQHQNQNESCRTPELTYGLEENSAR